MSLPDAPGATGMAPALKGITLAVTAMFMLAWMDSISKILVVDYTVPQILWIRFAGFALFAVGYSLATERRLKLRSKRPVLQIVRSLTLVAEIACFIFAFRYLSLAESHSMGAAAPLMVTGLAVFFLGEKIGRRRISAIVAGLIGVLVILRPGLGVFDIAALLPLAGAFLFALYQIFTKMVGSDDTPNTTLLYTGVVGFIVLSFIGPFFWIAPDLNSWGLLLLATLLGAIGHFMLIKALELAPASTIQPFNYSIFVWAILVGFVVFDDLPDFFTLLGGAIIVVSGLYALWRERVKSR